MSTCSMRNTQKKNEEKVQISKYILSETNTDNNAF